MLVLTRRKDEAIMLGEDIKITILDIDSDRIKIGIDAPKATRILRAELKTEVSNVNREATQTNLQFLQQLSQTNEKKTVEQPVKKQEHTQDVTQDDEK